MEQNDIQNDAPKQPVVEVAEEKVVGIEEKPVAEKPVAPEKKKKTNVAAILAVIFGILAFAGIGFGVWGMIEKNQADEKQKELTTKIEDVSGKLANCLNGEEVEETEVKEETEVVKEEVDTEKYIYVGEWGLKIKIPERLKRVSYGIRQFGFVSDEGGTSLIVWGNIDDRLPDFADPSKNNSGLGAIARIPENRFSGTEYDGLGEEIRACGVDAGLVFSSDGYNYCYSHPQDVYSTGVEVQGSEVESTKIVEEMLGNPENYSAI